MPYTFRMWMLGDEGHAALSAMMQNMTCMDAERYLLSAWNAARLSLLEEMERNGELPQTAHVKVGGNG